MSELLNETLAIAYGEDKAKEMLKAWDYPICTAYTYGETTTSDRTEINEVVTSTSHRYLTKEELK